VSDDAIYRWTFQRVPYVMWNVCMSLYGCVRVWVYAREACISGIIRFAWWSSSKAEVEGLPITPKRFLCRRSSWSIHLSYMSWCNIPHGYLDPAFGNACQRSVHLTPPVPSLAARMGEIHRRLDNRPFPFLKQKRICNIYRNFNKW